MLKTNLWRQQGKKKLGQIEKVALTYIHSWVKQIVSGKLLDNTGSPARHSVGWDWEVGGKLNREGVYICSYD